MNSRFLHSPGRPSWAGILLLIFLLPSTLWAQIEPRDESRYEIALIGERWTPDPGLSEAVKTKAALLKSNGDAKTHVLVQFWDLPESFQKGARFHKDMDLGKYVAGQAYMATVPASRLLDLEANPLIRSVVEWDASRKQHPRLKVGKIGAWNRDAERPDWVRLHMVLHHDVELDQGLDVAARVGGMASAPVVGTHSMTVWLPEARIRDLADAEEVMWLEAGAGFLSPALVEARPSIGATAVQEAPYDLDGTGVRVFIYDGQITLAEHDTFGGRMLNIDTDPNLVPHSHATHVAGIAIGSGAGSENNQHRGMAPGARGFSAGVGTEFEGVPFAEDMFDLEADYALARRTHEVDLANNSLNANLWFGNRDCDLAGDYALTSALLDGIVRGDNQRVGSDVISIWANGNERVLARCGNSFGTTTPPACAKNPIQVGAVNSDFHTMTRFSSWGPCDDGRLKPIVVAPGDNEFNKRGPGSDDDGGIMSSVETGAADYRNEAGTSMASPAVAGVVALLIEDWRARGHGGANDRPMNALVKSMLIHTALERGHPGPDYKYGYGAVDAKGLIDLLREGTGQLGQGTTNWGTDTVARRKTRKINVDVPPNTAELKVSIAWDDPAAAPMAANALINNLDLSVRAPDRFIHRPWVLDGANPAQPATRGVNRIDNQEQILIENPAPGRYQIRVRGAAIVGGPQPFAMSYSVKASEPPNPNCNSLRFNWDNSNQGWTLVGLDERLARRPAPVGGQGNALALGSHAAVEGAFWSFAYRAVHIPEGVEEATMTYSTFLEKETQQPTDFHAGVRITIDPFEQPDVSGPFSFVESQSNNSLGGVWERSRPLDLRQWAGQTVRINLEKLETAELPAITYIDDLELRFCGGEPSQSNDDDTVDPPNSGLTSPPSDGGPRLPGLPGEIQRTFFSSGAEDGWVRESAKDSGLGGIANSTAGDGLALRLGDDRKKRQFVSVISFFYPLPGDGPHDLTSGKLRLRASSLTGQNPIESHGPCWVDLTVEQSIGNDFELEAEDFQAQVPIPQAGQIVDAGDDWYEASFSEPALQALGSADLGLAQMRLRCELTHNGDKKVDRIGFFSGDHENPEFHPQMVLTGDFPDN